MKRDYFGYESNLGASLPDPRVVTHTYYCNFVKFISSNNCGLLSLNEEQFVLLSNFFTYFLLQDL